MAVYNRVNQDTATKINMTAHKIKFTSGHTVHKIMYTMQNVHKLEFTKSVHNRHKIKYTMHNLHKSPLKVALERFEGLMFKGLMCSSL